MSEQKRPEPKADKKERETDKKQKEFGGFENKAEPTRYGDWEVDGRCSDF